MSKILGIILVGLVVFSFSNPAQAGDKLVIGTVMAQPGDMGRYISILVSNRSKVSLGFRLRYDPKVIQVTGIRSMTERPNLIILSNLNNRPFVPGNLSFGLADFSYNQLIEPEMLREVGRIYFNIPADTKEGTYILKVRSLTGISKADVMVYSDGSLVRPDIFDGQLIITAEPRMKPLAN